MKKLCKKKEKAAKSPLKKKIRARLMARAKKKLGRLFLRLLCEVAKLAVPMAVGAALYANKDLIAEKLKKSAPEGRRFGK